MQMEIQICGSKIKLLEENMDYFIFKSFSNYRRPKGNEQ